MNNSDYLRRLIIRDILSLENIWNKVMQRNTCHAVYHNGRQQKTTYTYKGMVVVQHQVGTEDYNFSSDINLLCEVGEALTIARQNLQLGF